MIQWQIIGALLILLKQKGGWEREGEGGGRLRNYTGGDQHIYHCRRANLKLDGKITEFGSCKASRTHDTRFLCAGGPS